MFLTQHWGSADILVLQLYKPQVDSNKAVKAYLDAWTPHLKSLAEGHSELPAWIPSEEDLDPSNYNSQSELEDAIASIARLRIPCYPDDQPCLLLHDLGKNQTNETKKKLKHIFGRSFHT